MPISLSFRRAARAAVLLAACSRDQGLPAFVDSGASALDAAGLDAEGGLDANAPDLPPVCTPPQTGMHAALLAALFERDFLDAVCTREVDCGQICAGEHARCVAGATSYLGVSGYTIAEAVGAGRVGFSPEGAAACLARWRRDDCDPAEFAGRFDLYTRQDVYSGCEPKASPYQYAADPLRAIRSPWCPCALLPLVPDGAACRSSRECMSGGFCARGACGQPGVCRPPARTGESCGRDSPCASSDVCEGNCHPLLAAGRACASSWKCQPDLVCHLGVCTPRGGDGAPCADDDPDLTPYPYCYHDAWGLRCAAGFYCSEKGVCRPRVPVGAACLEYRSCAGNAVCVGVGSPGKCLRFADYSCSGAKEQGFEGGECWHSSEDFFPAPCEYFLYCDGTTNRCVRQLLPGEDCSHAILGEWGFGQSPPCYTGYPEIMSGYCDKTGRCPALLGGPGCQ